MSQAQPVAVISGGNGGYAAAADLSDRGISVRHYVRTPAHHTELLDTKRIRLRVSEVYQGNQRTPGTVEDVPIETVTDDLAEALSDAKLILVLVPKLHQRKLFSDLAPHLTDDQTVLLAPGGFGAWILREHLEDRSHPPGLSRVMIPKK